MSPASPRGREIRRRVDTARSVVLAQRAFFREHFGRVESRWKEDRTRVTFVDHAISGRILPALGESFPGDDLLSEEADPAEGVTELRGRFAWVLDPVDGTNNYALGVPECAISLALLEDGFPVYGFIYDHAGDRLLHGGPGAGLFVDDRAVAPGSHPLGPETVIGLQFPLPPGSLSRFRPLLEAYRIRSLGSSALLAAYAALGVLAGAADFRPKVWDLAAAAALVAGAGREVRFFAKSPFPLEEFHPGLGPCPYYAGTAAFLAAIEERFGGSP